MSQSRVAVDPEGIATQNPRIAAGPDGRVMVVFTPVTGTNPHTGSAHALRPLGDSGHPTIYTPSACFLPNRVPDRFLMAQELTDVTVAEVKQLLDRFAASRTNRSRRDVEVEYGDLLLYLILLAGKSGVDLVAGANVELDRRGRGVSRPGELGQ